MKPQKIIRFFFENNSGEWTAGGGRATQSTGQTDIQTHRYNTDTSKHRQIITEIYALQQLLNDSKTKMWRNSEELLARHIIQAVWGGYVG